MSADTIAARIAADPWHTPLGLCSKAVWDAEEATDKLGRATSPEARRDLVPVALRALVRARRYLLEASRASDLTSADRQQLRYLGETCDSLAARQGIRRAA